MVDPLTRARLTHRALFVALALLVLFLRLLPITPALSGFAGPDLVTMVIFAWLLRRPDYVPAGLIIAMLVIEDIFFQRPFGLWPLLMLLTSEALRRNEQSLRGLPFYGEFGLVAALLFGMVTLQQLLLALTFSPRPPYGQVLFHAFEGLVAYPFLVGLAALLGVSRPALDAGIGRARL